MRIAEIRRAIGEIEAGLRHKTADWEVRMAKWEASLPPQPKWEVVRLKNLGDNGQRYIDQPDGSILCQGYAPTKFSTDMRGRPTLESVTGTSFGQSSVTAHVTEARIARRRPGRAGARA